MHKEEERTQINKINEKGDPNWHHRIMGFPCDSAGKESTCNARDLGLIPGLGRSLGEGHGNPL